MVETGLCSLVVEVEDEDGGEGGYGGKGHHEYHVVGCEGEKKCMYHYLSDSKLFLYDGDVAHAHHSTFLS